MNAIVNKGQELYDACDCTDVFMVCEPELCVECCEEEYKDAPVNRCRECGASCVHPSDVCSCCDYIENEELYESIMPGD